MIIGWHYSSHGDVVTAAQGIDIPTYSSTDGCMSRDHWEAFKSAVLHVHAVVNNTVFLSLNSTGDEAARPTYLPKALSSYAIMMSETDDMREFVQGTIKLGPGLNAIYETAV
eukprot:jgi/Botrbrau1/3093/Bobra.0070s0079.2